MTIANHYYIGEGQEADVLLTDVRQRSETAQAARTKLMEDYGADALILSWKGKPVGLGFRQEQRTPYLKEGSRRYEDGFAYYPKMNTKAGKELSAKLDAPELEFSASGYILKLLKLSRMVVDRCSGSPTGMAYITLRPDTFHLGKVDAKNNKVTFIPIEPEQNEGAKHDR